MMMNFGDDAFSWCTNVMYLTIGNKVTTIGKNAFACCKAVRNLEIPASVQSIGQNAFDGCKKFKSIVFRGKTMDDIPRMVNYPFGIADTSVISAQP